ncbi:MAG: DoxX family membrane protein [Bacteroidota bacterium]
MNNQRILNIGRWMFALTFVMGGILHLTGPEFTATQVPEAFGAPIFWVYFTGIAQIAFAVSALIRKYDQLAALLLCLMMLVFIFSMHIPKAASGDFMGVISTMRDFGYAGAALLYAGGIARDRIFTPAS